MTARIAITGIGIVSAIGQTARDTFDSLVSGRRGFSPITLFDTAGQRSNLAAEVAGFRVEDVAPRGAVDRWSRSDALALAAAREAAEQAGLDLSRPSASVGLAVGVTTAGMLEAEERLAAQGQSATGTVERLVSYPLSSTAARLGEVFPALGRVATVCSACSSGSNALVQAAAWLQTGAADSVLAGGTDALCRLTLTGFNSLGATDLVPCRPFDRARAGLTLGEGAAFLVLETEEAARRRGARVISWLSGWAVGAEAHHITQPEPTGRVPSLLLRDAIRRARLSPSDVDYVNAHGTGTVSNDAVETLAIHDVFGEGWPRVLVSSSKGQLGHTLGAAGAVEAAVTALALERQIAPPTGGLELPGEDCDLRHVMGKGIAAPLRVAISSSFGFGGTGTTLLFERTDAERRSSGATTASVAVTAVACLAPDGLHVGGDCARYLGASPATGNALEDLHALLAPAKSRRFDRQACLVTKGAEEALRGAGRAPADVGLVAATAFGNVERTVEFMRRVAAGGPRRAPPAEFPHLVPSAASGNASIYLGLSGPVLSTCDLEAGGEAAFVMACDWVLAGFSPAMLAGAAEAEDAFVRDMLGPACEGESLAPRTEGTAWLAVESEEAARERGARCLARVRRHAQVRLSRLEDVAIEGPLGPSPTVISGSGGERFAPVLSRSGWAKAGRRSVVSGVGFHEGIGGFSLAAAVALLSTGDRSDVLVVGANGAHAYWVHLTGLS